ncbi:MAG: RluA family pseudouridine synthase [Hydrogenophaga sp.]
MPHTPTAQAPSPQATAAPVPPGLVVLHADEHLLVLDKPAGLLSVPGRGEDKQDCLSARAQDRFPDALIVHRLDMATSGLMVMGRGAEAQRRLSLAFEQRRVHKRYVAVVEGVVRPTLADGAWAVIDLPLIVDWLARPRSKVDHDMGKPSITRWRVAPQASPLPGTTRLELEPLTGRSHQLRVHLQAMGHPIVGDPLYAPPQFAVDRLLLHAQRLTVPHPVSGEPCAFQSPCPF